MLSTTIRPENTDSIRAIIHRIRRPGGAIQNQWLSDAGVIRNSEMHQITKGNQWHFCMKARRQYQKRPDPLPLATDGWRWRPKINGVDT